MAGVGTNGSNGAKGRPALAISAFTYCQIRTWSLFAKLTALPSLCAVALATGPIRSF
jgi:hypothetical protein